MRGGGGAGDDAGGEDDVDGVVAAPLAVRHPCEDRLGPDDLPYVVTHAVETQPASCAGDLHDNVICIISQSSRQMSYIFYCQVHYYTLQAFDS